jgi:hypothetical protein
VWVCVCVCVCRKIELYEMGWSLRDGLKECLVAAAPYGGPIGEYTHTHTDMMEQRESLAQFGETHIVAKYL